jgi:hypothetical protein
MLNRIFDLAIAYIEMAFEFVISHVLTLEGIIALIFGLFLLGLVSRIR